MHRDYFIIIIIMSHNYLNNLTAVDKQNKKVKFVCDPKTQKTHKDSKQTATICLLLKEHTFSNSKNSKDN